MFLFAIQLLVFDSTNNNSNENCFLFLVPTEHQWAPPTLSCVMRLSATSSLLICTTCAIDKWWLPPYTEGHHDAVQSGIVGPVRTMTEIVFKLPDGTDSAAADCYPRATISTIATNDPPLKRRFSSSEVRQNDPAIEVQKMSCIFWQCQTPIGDATSV